MTTNLSLHDIFSRVEQLEELRKHDVQEMVLLKGIVGEQGGEIINLKMEKGALIKMNTDLVNYIEKNTRITICQIIKDSWNSVIWPNWHRRQIHVDATKLAKAQISLKKIRNYQRVVHAHVPVNVDETSLVDVDIDING